MCLTPRTTLHSPLVYCVGIRGEYLKSRAHKPSLFAWLYHNQWVMLYRVRYTRYFHLKHNNKQKPSGSCHCSDSQSWLSKDCIGVIAFSESLPFFYFNFKVQYKWTGTFIYIQIRPSRDLWIRDFVNWVEIVIFLKYVLTECCIYF